MNSDDEEEVGLGSAYNLAMRDSLIDNRNDWAVHLSHMCKKHHRKRKSTFCHDFQGDQSKDNRLKLTTADDSPRGQSAKQRGKVAHTARPGKLKDTDVNSLIEMRDESTRAVSEAEVWEENEMIVESGASGTVVGGNMIKAVEANNAKTDVTFKLADGSRTPHMGRKPTHLTRTKDTSDKWWQLSWMWKMPC